MEKLSAPFSRIALITIGVVLGLLIMALTFRAASYLLSPYNDLRFDPTLWLKSKNDSHKVECVRGRMVDDIQARVVTPGRLSSEIEATLGRPEAIHQSVEFQIESSSHIKVIWSYPIGAWSGFKMDTDYLAIGFDDEGRVVESWLYQS